MSERPKLNLKANVPVDVRFRFADPLEKEGKFGEYDIWTVETEGVEHVLFASNGLRDAIRTASPSAGETLQIMKTEREEGKGFNYSVERPGETAENTAPRARVSEEETIHTLTGRYVTICQELSRQWPELHDKDAELFKSAATSIFIQISRG